MFWQTRLWYHWHGINELGGHSGEYELGTTPNAKGPLFSLLHVLLLQPSTPKTVRFNGDRRTPNRYRAKSQNVRNKYVPKFKVFAMKIFLFQLVLFQENKEHHSRKNGRYLAELDWQGRLGRGEILSCVRNRAENSSAHCVCVCACVCLQFFFFLHQCNLTVLQQEIGDNYTCNFSPFVCSLTTRNYTE